MLRYLILLISSLSIATPVTNQLQQHIRNNLSNSTFGMVVTEADSGKVIYANSAHSLFLPASTLKLFTAAAALYELGKDYTYTTSLAINPHSDTDLYINFSGDPSLTVNDLAELLHKAQVNGLQQINNLIIDDSIFVGPYIADGWMNEDLNWYFAAPASGMILNENRSKISISSSLEIGKKLQVESLDPHVKLNISANVESVSLFDSENLCKLHIDYPHIDDIRFSGCWPVREKEYIGYLSIKHPRAYFAKYIEQLFDRLKINFLGKVIYQSFDLNQLNTIAEHKSSQLKDLLIPMLNDSNNLYADSMLKTLGAKYYSFGSYKTGIQALSQILQRHADIDLNQLRIEDGSGLSRYNLVTPISLAKLLHQIYILPDLRKDFIFALDVDKGKGVIRRRFANLRVKAKTGSMSNTSSLAGYFTAKTGKEFIFVSMINNSLIPREKLQEFEQSLIKILVNNL